MGGDDATVAYPLFQAENRGSIPTSPLQLRVGRISHETFRALNRLWHSRLPECNNAFEGVGICYGMEFEGRYYAVSYWSHPVSASIDSDGCYELRRMAVGPLAPRHTPSRFLSVMVKLLRKDRPTLNRLISYQDTDVHQGTIYKASGWTPTHWGDRARWDTNKNRVRVNGPATGPKIRWEKVLGPARLPRKEKMPDNKKCQGALPL